jgi:thiol-disulfide isomerase/thioredoxin
MKYLLIILLAFTSLLVSAQSDSLQPPYKRFPTLPPFDLLALDSASSVTKETIQKDKPVLIMFFSPDCDHCKHQMEDMLKDMKPFDDIEIVLATFQPFEQIKTFYQKYELSKYKNVYIGRDTKYFLPPFYRMYNLPYLALYNSKGDLITTFEGNVKPDKLIKAFK